MEKEGDELGATVGGDVQWDSMFGEDVEYEQMGQLCRVHFVGHQDKNPLLHKPINNHKDCSKTGALRELLDEIHRDGIPRFLRYGQLLERSIWLMPRGFRPTTSCARFAKVRYESSEFQPGIIPEDQG